MIKMNDEFFLLFVCLNNPGLFSVLKKCISVHEFSCTDAQLLFRHMDNYYCENNDFAGFDAYMHEDEKLCELLVQRSVNDIFKTKPVILFRNCLERVKMKYIDKVIDRYIMESKG